jgi:thiol-disulfide isomerase/thioredoxin
MSFRTFAALSLVTLLGATAALPAQQQQDAAARKPDAEFRDAFADWQTKWDAYTKAIVAARQEGRIAKGGELPETVAALLDAANAQRDAILARFGSGAQFDGLTVTSLGSLARLHEANRDYRAAAETYAKAIAAGDAKTPDLRTLHALCIAAMNAKDDALAARWMKTTIAAEDAAGARRGSTIRASYYPRTLIALGDWKALDAHLDTLAADPAPECRTAATTFRVVARLKDGDVAAAEKLVAGIREAPETYPDSQAWAVLAQLAIDVHHGRFDDGAAMVRTFLEQPATTTNRASAVDANQRRYLAAVAPFLGKPAPALRVDHWVGGKVEGELGADGDPFPALRGRIVVLDFWQPWCEPCRNAMPKLVAVQKAHPDDVVVLGPCRIEDYGYDVSEKKAVRPLAAADYPAHVEDFHRDMQLNYPLVISATRANNDAYRIAGVPTLVVVDRLGIVRYMSCGAGEPGLFEIALAGVLRHGN